MEQNVIRESKCKDKLSSLSFHPHTYYIPIQDSESLNSSLKALQLVSKVPFDVVITNPNKVFTCDLSESSIQYLILTQKSMMPHLKEEKETKKQRERERSK